MELFDAIKKTILLRPNTIPASKNIGIVCFESAISSIPDVLLDNAQFIFVIDAQEEQLQTMSREIYTLKKRKISFLPFAEISSRIDLEFVFYHHNFESRAQFYCYRYMRNAGYESFYTFFPISYDNGMTFTHNPDYYSFNKENLERVFKILNDDKSKEVFAARIRAIVSGCVGYLKVSEYEEYFHPLVALKKGDIVIDGGISEYISSQLKFLEVIGPTGKWFGFEPDPVGFHAASEKIKKLAPHNNHHIVHLGLWDKQDKLYFEILGEGTRGHQTKRRGSIECDVISIDEFINQNNLDKVDFIKLDVEGAELNVLKGCIQTITKYRPKLAISLYHQPQDLYQIPIFLSEICMDYEFYLGHHHSALHETILYAKPKLL